MVTTTYLHDHTLTSDASDAVADYSYLLNTTSFIWTPINIANTNLGAGSRFGHSGRQIKTPPQHGWLDINTFNQLCFIMTDPSSSSLVLMILACWEMISLSLILFIGNGFPISNQTAITQIPLQLRLHRLRTLLHPHPSSTPTQAVRNHQVHRPTNSPL